jgi:hypothetical protein
MRPSMSWCCNRRSIRCLSDGWWWGCEVLGAGDRCAVLCWAVRCGAVRCCAVRCGAVSGAEGQTRGPGRRAGQCPDLCLGCTAACLHCPRPRCAVMHRTVLPSCSALYCRDVPQCFNHTLTKIKDDPRVTVRLGGCSAAGLVNLIAFWLGGAGPGLYT